MLSMLKSAFTEQSNFEKEFSSNDQSQHEVLCALVLRTLESESYANHSALLFGSRRTLSPASLLHNEGQRTHDEQLQGSCVPARCGLPIYPCMALPHGKLIPRESDQLFRVRSSSNLSVLKSTCEGTFLT